MSQYIGIDFGARVTEICVRGRGIVLREPTVAAVDTRGNVIAAGSEALLIAGRSPGTVTVRRPLSSGSITDFDLTAEILDRFLETAVPKVKKHVIATVKYGFGSNNRELLVKALTDCRTGKITLADSASAALMGSGADISYNRSGEYDGSAICDIGASSLEAAYIRNGEIMRICTTLEAGDAADAAIVAYIRRKYGLSITRQAANEAKHKLDLTPGNESVHTFLGTDGSSGMPRKVQIKTSELVRPCAPQSDRVAELLSELLSNLPHHGENVSTAGRIILTGGGASIPGIAGYISQKLGREVTVAAAPADSVIRGLNMMLEQKR